MALPDSSFLYVRKGGQRLFPYKDAAGAVDRRLAEGLVRDIITSDLSAPIKANLMTRARAIARRTTEAELHSYLRPSNPKESNMSTTIYARISEAILRLKVDRLKMDVKRQKLSDAKPPAAPEEKPVVGSMQESYALPAEVISEVAAFKEGEERVLRGCTFISSGLNIPQTRRWPAELLEANISLFDKALCYIDHPGDGQPRSLRALAGHTRNPRFDDATSSVIGDIVLLGNEAADYVVDVFGNEVVRDSGDVGLSVLFEPGRFDAEFEEHGDRTIQVPTRLGPDKPTVDFVSNPTAHGLVGPL